jgi:hypothetical protein
VTENFIVYPVDTGHLSENMETFKRSDNDNNNLEKSVGTTATSKQLRSEVGESIRFKPEISSVAGCNHGNKLVGSSVSMTIWKSELVGKVKVSTVDVSMVDGTRSVVNIPGTRSFVDVSGMRLLDLTAGENDTTSEIFETALNDTTVLDVREKDSMKKHSNAKASLAISHEAKSGDTSTNERVPGDLLKVSIFSDKCPVSTG